MAVIIWKSILMLQGTFDIVGKRKYVHRDLVAVSSGGDEGLRGVECGFVTFRVLVVGTGKVDRF
ncbi:hypothetical protein [Lacticaseibacillus sp. GG6-2]